MTKAVFVAVGLGVALAGGCSENTGRVRPPVDELSDDGRGLQGKDVITASNEMAQSLLSSPALNASQQQWTIVVDKVENLTATQRGNLDSFLQRTRVRLSQLGQGRVQLVENRAKLQQLQANELDVTADRFGQGGMPGGPNGRVQPDYALYARLSDLPARNTAYFLVQFTLVDLRRGTEAWSGMYEVSTNL